MNPCHESSGVGVMAAVEGHWGVCWTSFLAVFTLGS